VRASDGDHEDDRSRLLSLLLKTVPAPRCECGLRAAATESARPVAPFPCEEARPKQEKCKR